MILSPADSIPYKDFVLRYHVVGKKPEMAVLGHTGHYADARRLGHGYFMLMIQPKEDERLTKSPPREIVFLLDVSGSMRNWTVPMSGGRIVKVHERAYPAFQLVSQNLAARQAEGKYCNVRIAASFVWRRIGGSYRMSTHAFGTTIDINWDTNPYRSDNELVTDMPTWFVDAWRDAGFCWGGDWLYIKDTMHFSWMGPAATVGYGTVPPSYAVDTAAASYTDDALNTQTLIGDLVEHTYLIADGDGNGLADVFQLVPRDNGTRLEYSQTDRKHSWCSLGRDHALNIEVGDRVVLMGDYSRTGRNDMLLSIHPATTSLSRCRSNQPASRNRSPFRLSSRAAPTRTT